MEHKTKHPGADHAPSPNAEKHFDQQSVLSIGGGRIDGPDTNQGGLHRTLSPRMIHVISLGSSIGSGLFIATGKALADGGPGNMFLGYLVVCIGVWANLQTLTEMTVAFPTSGNYIDYADRWVDPALAFGAGFAEWLGWTSVFASEATFLVILVNFWAGGAVPEAALLTIFLVVCLGVFLMPTPFFGWLEYLGSLIKAFLFVFITIISLAIIGGAGPTGYVRDGSTWTALPAFKNSFGGFSNAALLAIWAVGDQVFIGVMAGEAESPRFSMAHAANLIPWRVAVFYLLSVVLVSLIVPSTESRLLGGSSVASSPFVIAVQDAGIRGVPDLINACMIIGILAIALECIFLPSRILRTMSLQRLLPRFVANVDDQGRPRWALAITAVAGVILTYMSLSAGGTEVLNWLIAITSASFFTNWAIIAVTSFRFRAAVRAQQSPVFGMPYAWQSAWWPLAPAISLALSGLLLVCLLYTSIKPGGGGFTAYSFFSSTIGLILILVCTIAYKIMRRTPWRDPVTADLVTGRRELSSEELRLLDAYYARPLWRRMGTYLRVW
ncbi:proline-specific permease [Aspergillus saccharolyticus JOP 1030-1]|uniref:Proline-specific permease n=1 Tax=Aspergillus saccharolyticus JOP 1030-1 TaxID=1450539 RepID=A0A318ZGV7_9EURO|nr:proline-specific permease [Aspergillus saccharolyticus JOP 1030-1]PYH45987.1 proline-specific permease [Aspergillus saccharolyticus JOP 1030-1]